MKPEDIQGCFVISLERTPEDLDAFHSRLPSPWMFSPPATITACDGRLLPHPKWWRAGSGAWGCYRSHVQILEHCLQHGISSYVVFEVDATFCKDFPERVEQYFAHLPHNTGIAYLGGQHLAVTSHPPQRINDHVYKAWNVNRTHAFAVLNRNAMEVLYQHLHARDWKPSHHIDHHMGRLTQSQRVRVVTPARWLCGQLKGTSTISGKTFAKDRFYNHAEVIDSTQRPFVAVMGLHRSGSSCLAMILHKLGLHLGNKLGGFEKDHGGGGEAVGLAQICERYMRFPSFPPSGDLEVILPQLSEWIAEKKREATKKNTIAAGKYPHLCAMGPLLEQICGRTLRVIVIERDIEESIESLQRRSREHPGKWYSAGPEECERLQRWLWEQREEWLSEWGRREAGKDSPTQKVLRLQHSELMQEPRKAIDQVIEFLGIEPTYEQIMNAVWHVKPKETGDKLKDTMAWLDRYFDGDPDGIYA